MRLSFTLPAAFFLLFSGLLQAQVAKDATVPCSAVVSGNPAQVILNWSNPAPANLLVLRRTKGQAGNQWVQLLNVTNSSLTSGVDNNVVAGQTYEYVIQRQTTILSYGYAHVAVEAPVTDSRGKVLLFVDADIVSPLAAELERLRSDLIGDGWQIVEHLTDASATVQSVRNQILADYNADPVNVKSIFLLGKIPVPYSGNANWDGHGDHAGAWPADVYYGDINGPWTDFTVNNTTPARDANDNVPADGKLDQSYIPSPVELPVGRVDFRRLSQGTFGATTVELMKRYLDKDHNWRVGIYTVENKALIDDNFGYFSNAEAFAGSGFRNAYPLVGEANIVETDFFNNSNPQSYLLGYGCGGGSYTSAGGVGSSDNFATDTVNIVFSHLFGSYHGDWDYEVNPFMPSALACRGGILTCAWAGRPHHFNQAMASGETIGYCLKETQNAQFNNGFFQSVVGESGAHVSLLGDPTLRAHIVAPAGNVIALSGCGAVRLSWTASTDTAVAGYHVYRAFSKNGAYTRLTTNAVTGTVYSDLNPVNDTLYYQVRAVKRQTSPGGGIYWNTATGALASLVYSPATPPTVTAAAASGLTCANNSVTLEAVSSGSGATFSWTGPGGFTSSLQNPVVTQPGTYAVTATLANGCTGTASAAVAQNITPPTAAATGGVITCDNPTVLLTGSSITPGATFAWSGPCLTGSGAEAACAGIYVLTVTNPQNGCTSSAEAVVTEDTAIPVLALPATLTYTCQSPCASLLLPGLPGLEFYLDNQLLSPNEPLLLCDAGNIVITSRWTANGCTHDYPIEIVADTDAPGAGIAVDGPIQVNCTGTDPAELSGSSVAAGAIYAWTGPLGFISNQQNITVAYPGDYTLVVTGPNGCTSSDVATVQANQDSDVPTAAAGGGTLTCSNTSVKLNGESSTPDVTFKWTGPGGFTSTLEDPVVSVPGLYVFTVSAPNGCFNEVTVNVLSDVKIPEYTLGVIPQLNCDNDCITLDVTTDPPGLFPDPYSVCEPGAYNVTITNPLNGCANAVQFTVTEAPPLSGNLSANLDCDLNGTLTAEVTGGTPPYHYLWSTGDTTATIQLPLTGPLAFTVTDAGGCKFETGPVIISVPATLVTTSILTNASTPDATDGGIDLSVSGGIPPYTYIWSTGATTQDLINIPAGDYYVTVTDANGCTRVALFTVDAVLQAGTPPIVQALTLTPNPTTGPARLTLQLERPAPVRVSVYDLTGRLVLENRAGTVSSLNWPLDLSSWPPGLYKVLVLAEDQTVVCKLAVGR